MRKRLVVGDIHGRWGYLKQIYEHENPDDVIILGDYFDSYNIYPIDQKFSYENIVNLKTEHEKQYGSFIMLVGNHDMHYLTSYIGQHSGYSIQTQNLIGYMIEKHVIDETLVPVYIDKINKTIYSHAGISNCWLNQWFDGDIYNVSLNKFYDKHFYHPFEFTYKGGGDIYGSSKYNGCTWIRPSGLLKDPYKDENGYIWTQIFGHTQSEAPMIYDVSDTTKFYNIDCIYKAYLVETLDDDGKLISRELKDYTFPV